MKKVIIFDFDGTLYSGKDVFKLVPDYVNNHRREFLLDLSDEEYNKVCNENPNFLKVSIGKEIVNELYLLKNKYPTFNIGTKRFCETQEKYVYDIFLENAHIVNTLMLENICSKYTTYIVSNSSQNHIKHYMKIFNINPNWFKEIISNNFYEYDSSKKPYYEYILNKENVKPCDVFVFGDSYSSDLEPAKKLNLNTFLVDDTNNLENIILNAIFNK